MTSTTYVPSVRTTPTRAAQRVSYDREAVHAVLDEALHCHVGTVVDGSPVVLPYLHARVGERLYLHGSSGARLLRQARDAGLPVCVTVTLLDALVLAKSAFHHSMNYRCVVAHGLATVVEDEAEKRAALDAVVDAVRPGRSQESRPANAKELAATTVLALELQDVSLKVRGHGPVDDDEDLALPFWSGLVPVTQVLGEPVEHAPAG